MQPEILEQAVDLNGKPRGLFNDDGRISDPRGLGVNRDEGLLSSLDAVTRYSVAPEASKFQN